LEQTFDDDDEHEFEENADPDSFFLAQVLLGMAACLQKEELLVLRVET
jgi:hypothetical protein